MWHCWPRDLAGSGAGGPGAIDQNSLTPAAVAQMPEQVRTIIVSSYNEALAPIYLYLVPIMVVGMVLLLWVREKPLALTNEVPAPAAAQPGIEPLGDI